MIPAMSDFTWTISSLASSADTGLIKQCAFSCEHLHGSFEGSVTLPDIDVLSSSFIPYEELNEAIVLEWLFNVLGDEKTVVEEVASREPSASSPPTTNIVNGKPW